MMVMVMMVSWWLYDRLSVRGWVLEDSSPVGIRSIVVEWWVVVVVSCCRVWFG
jgi:hypothetical protein